MGGRYTEFFLGLWLAISWMIFRYTEDVRAPLMINDFICCILITFFSLGSYIKQLRHIHLMNFLMGIWLIVFSLFTFVPENSKQNYATLGILLLMISIVPSHTAKPSYSWMEFLKKRFKT